MTLVCALTLAMFSVAPSDTTPTLAIAIDNQGSSALYQYAMPVTLRADHLPASFGSPESVDFSRIRFYQNSDLSGPLDFWISDQQGGVQATFWLRLPVLPQGHTVVTCAYVDAASPPYQATSYAGRLLANDGVHLDLQTDPPDKETVHPSVVMAEGWMTRRHPEDPPTVNRVLVDTMWPQDPSPYQYPNQLENPEVWLSEDNGLTWAWPPDTDTNPAWPQHNNWLVDTSPYGTNSDPDAIFLRAGSLPSGGPPVDTLRVYHRNNKNPGSNVVFIDVTSANGAWSGVQINGYNWTNLVDVQSRFISPAVVQESDGSLRMWVTNSMPNSVMTMALYSSADGVTFTKVSDVDLGTPNNMFGPWHIDVIKAGGVYWLSGSFGPNWNAQANMRDLYMMRSEDGLHFSLLLPTVLELAPGWFCTGTYRPSMLYVPGEGLEFYVGSSGPNSSAPGDGGTGRWLDPGWIPEQPRPAAEAITTVFWGSARHFDTPPDQWPHPWWAVDDSQNSSTMTHDDSAVTVTANSPVVHRGRIDSSFVRPQNHEYWFKARIDHNCYASIYAAGTSGPYIDSRNNGQPPYGASCRWGSTTPVAGPMAMGDLDAFHVFRLRRLGDQGRCWWDGTELSGSPFSMYGIEYRDDLGPQVMRVQGNWLSVDWYFYRDAVDPEPSVEVGYPGDLNWDGDVDQDDLVLFDGCWSGPAIPRGGSDTCQRSDLDNDGDVDQSDFGILQRCLAGPDVTPDPHCAD